MTPSEPSNVLPEAEAAERLRQHLEEVALERDRAHRALQEREAELARIQRIARVGGLEIDFRDGVKNRRSPEYLLVHGLPPDAASETYDLLIMSGASIDEHIKGGKVVVLGMSKT